MLSSKSPRVCGMSVAVEFGFCNNLIDWLGGFTASGALHGGVTGSTGVDVRGKTGEADGGRDVVVDGLHASSHAVGLVPEARAARVFHELRPPGAVGFRAGPG